MKPPTANKWP